MPRVKRPLRSKRNSGREPDAVKTGCVQQRVAPATPNCTSEPERRPQSRAAQPACASTRTLDGESARRLAIADSSLTSNTVASLRSGWRDRALLRLRSRCSLRSA